MFTISRKDNTIEISIDTGVGWTITARHTRSQGLDAFLLCKQLQTRFYDRVEAIRREAYEAGWNDKKKRNLKRDWFPGRMDKDISDY